MDLDELKAVGMVSKATILEDRGRNAMRGPIEKGVLHFIETLLTRVQAKGNST